MGASCMKTTVKSTKSVTIELDGKEAKQLSTILWHVFWSDVYEAAESDDLKYEEITELRDKLVEVLDAP